MKIPFVAASLAVCSLLTLASFATTAQAQGPAERERLDQSPASHRGPTSDDHRPSKASFRVPRTQAKWHLDGAYEGGAFMAWATADNTRRFSGVAPAGIGLRAGFHGDHLAFGLDLSRVYVTALSVEDDADASPVLRDPSDLLFMMDGLGIFLAVNLGDWSIGSGAGLAWLNTDRDGDLAEPRGLGTHLELSYRFASAGSWHFGARARVRAQFMSVADSFPDTSVTSFLPALGLFAQYDQ